MNAFLNPASSTAYLLEEIALFGVMSGKGERDYRPLPEAEDVAEKVGAIMQTMADLFLQTRLEGEAEEMLWSVVNGFHRRVSHTQKRLDDKAGEVKTALGQQDGSEIKDVELQGLTDECRSLEEARNAFEAMREIASEHFQVITGKPWLPRTGSKISHGATTAAARGGRGPRRWTAASISRPRRTRKRMPAAPRARVSSSPADRTSKMSTRSGACSTRPRPNIPTWSSCTAGAARAPS